MVLNEGGGHEMFATFFTRKNAIIGTAAVVGLLGFVVANHLLAYYTAKSYTDQIADTFNINGHGARALALVSFALLVYFGSKIFSLAKRNRLIGYAGVLSLLVVHSLVLWRASEWTNFSPDGASIKCFVLTKESVRYSERLGIDQESGKECRPVTPQLVERLHSYEKGLRPTRVASDNPVFFDLRTGEPIIWYAKFDSGEIELFDLMGFHPTTGEELLPVNKAIVASWREGIIHETREPPKKIIPTIGEFFDPRTGRAKVWYRKDEKSEYSFFDADGFDPLTGEKLSAVTREVVKDWGTKPQAQCYIITSEAVKYGDRSGIDPSTGKECREIKSGMLERLREYEKGKRPSRIADPNVVFFDPRTGSPIVWYSVAKSTDIELFDLMGFHPSTGEELLPITASVVEQFRAQQQKITAKHRSPPKRVNAESAVFFDPRSGAPVIWYWKSSGGNYEFFDGEGYHPFTGDPLALVTKTVLEEREAQIAKGKKDEEQAAIKRAQDAQLQTNAAIEIAAVGDKCDRLASNPTDPNKSQAVKGVTYDELKLTATAAIEACLAAQSNAPSVDRFKYQLARAYQVVSALDKAESLFEQLAEKRYVAVYDNYGWLLLKQQDANNRDYTAPEKFFRIGAAAGNADAMESLAELIERGKIRPRSETEGNDLTARAADLGNAEAQKRLVKIRQEGDRRDQAREQNEQGKEIMRNIFGSIIRGKLAR